MIIETEINVYDVACRLTRAPEEMAYTLQEFALCDPAILGRDCADHMTHGPRAEIAAWLRAFADALAPAPEAESAPETPAESDDDPFRAFMARLDSPSLTWLDRCEAIARTAKATGGIFECRPCGSDCTVGQWVISLGGVLVKGEAGHGLVIAINKWMDAARKRCAEGAS